MDVAIPFKDHFRLNESVQEFNIFFDPDKNNFDKLIEFIGAFGDHIINIEYRNGIDQKTASALAKVGENVRFRLKAEDIVKVDALRDRGCKFFFDSSVPANSWCSLRWMVEVAKIESVYVCDDLMYELDSVKDYCSNNSVRVRLIANRAPYSLTIGPKDYYAPIIRPQDMKTLSEFIDVIEFDCGDPCNFDKLAVMYKAYIKKGFWYGQLSELNPDVSALDIPCPSVADRLVEKRSTCGFRCARGHPCSTCEMILTLGESLKEIGARLP